MGSNPVVGTIINKSLKKGFFVGQYVSPSPYLN